LIKLAAGQRFSHSFARPLEFVELFAAQAAVQDLLLTFFFIIP